MTKRERINSILNLKGGGGKCGSWIGHPDPATLEIYTKALSVDSFEDLQNHFDDDCRWTGIWYDCAPGGGGWFNFGEHKGNGMDGCQLAHIETVAEVDALPILDPKTFDFSNLLKRIDGLQDLAVFTGSWSCFFHDMAHFFGMEEYFVKMYTHPEVIEAVTNRIVDFYVELNDAFFTELGDRGDILFFGNDFGTQLDIFVSLECFEKFIMPGFRKIINGAKKHNKKVILHSCGAISKVIPTLIDAGIDGLHPLQAKAAGMDAVTLAREYGKDIAFMGGIDTQELLCNGKPQEVYDEVMRLRDVFGDNFIASPSHEAILPNVPLANVEAMFKAIHE